MIGSDVIQNIIETARIEEVVGEYVSLRKRGVNLIGLCPFHNEKTPSFTVSPVKGIFKCFGCGKAGNSVNFLMEHEHFSYPEALKHLARKYNIEIEEEVQTAEQIASLDEKESLFTITNFAHLHFVDNLHNTEEGRAIGLSYFKEREFTDATIKKFELGYCLDNWDDFTAYAQKNGYKINQLVKAGFSIDKEGKQYDRFRARVMFPIHSLSGKVIAFGGRILGSDKSKPKYVNSPETDIYNKSKVLYGLNFAKNAIISGDNCFLVEGYTDVITLHQAGIENVVSSSGTSLTTEQIRLISRYTKNITILYDGDAAGIKASFRGIDMILEEGMNVKIVLFPDGEDPDSFTRKNRSAEVQEYIQQNANNFILFKTNLLLEEAAHDPIKKAELVKEIVNTISLIPDSISRSIYTKECSAMMNIPEQTLLNELNKLLRKKFSKKTTGEGEESFPEIAVIAEKQTEEVDFEEAEFQERDIIRLLLNFGTKEINVQATNEDNEKVSKKISIAQFIVNDILCDEFSFNNKNYQLIFNAFAEAIAADSLPNDQHFMHHADENIRNTAINLISSPYSLSENWQKMHRIFVPTEDETLILEESVNHSVYSFKLKKIEAMLASNAKEIKELTNDEDVIILMEKQKRLLTIKKMISAALGRIIIR
ncbi:MAG: DNA primase [Bacteroidetes bacterium]|nr:DNA primase [Bacteroidota bacterium]